MDQNNIPLSDPALHVPGNTGGVISTRPATTPRSEPVIPSTPTSLHSGPHRPPKKVILLSVIAFVVIGVLGGGYFAYSRGYLAIPFLSPKEDQLFDRLVDSLTEIDNAQYTVQVALQSENRSGNATSIFPSADERKAKSRDAERKADVASIRTALMLYQDDNRKFPESLDALAPNYINTLPTDPKDKSKYEYTVCDAGLHYIIQTGLESDEYFYVTDIEYGKTVSTVPACGKNTNTQAGLLRWLIPTVQAQATTFSIESIGSQVGLGQAENNYPLLNLLDLFGLGNMEALLDVFPADINASSAITFYAEADKKLKDANALLKISGSYRGDDLIAEFDLEGRKLGSTIYGTIRKFPGIPYLSQFVSPIKNKWVQIEPGDGNPFIEEDTFEQASLKNGVERTRESLKDALEGKIVTVERKMGTDNIAGVQSVHYLVALHPDKVKAVLEKIAADKKLTNQSLETINASIKQLGKPETQASLQRFVDNSTVEVWVDTVKGYLRQIRWAVVLVPPEDSQKLKEKQFRLTLTLTLDKVNQKVSVDKPAGAIDYDEAERLVTGVTVAEQKFNRQRSRIEAIRGVLGQIHEVNDSYPSSIEHLDQELKQALEKCKTKQKEKQNANSYAYIYCNDYLANESINTQDVYTEKTYGFSQVGDDFKLTYEMRLDFESSTSGYSYGSYYKEEYKEGLNTATSKDVSVEKTSDSEQYEINYNRNRNANVNASKNLNTNTSIGTNTNTVASFDADQDGIADSSEVSLYKTNPNKRDTDDDGLGDYLEIVYCQTNPLLADTDSDGHTDKEEVQNGYNPKGAGRAASNYCLEQLNSNP